MATQNELRQQITNRIIEALENGVMPWRRPWRQSKNTGRPANVVSKRTYSGINPLLLELDAMKKQFHSRFWGTYRQWWSLGCCVKKRPADVEPGHWGTSIVLFRPFEKTTTDPKTGDEEEKKFLLMRTFCVFNADQVEGAERFQVIEETNGQGQRQPDFEPAEELMRATGADIRHGGDKAFYSVAGDFICLPRKERFTSLGDYYSCAFHEVSHWAEGRVGWDRKANSYAMGELIAEMSSCFVSAELDIPNGESLENHAAYLKSWLEGMRGDVSYIFKASTQASKTTDFLLGFVRAPEAVEPVETEDGVLAAA
jgi:antirestriction protein ArdC